jgi:SsrA-binding protein
VPLQCAQKPKEIRNRKVGFAFFVGDKFEAGICLWGTEVKSLRAGKVSIDDAFVRLDKGANLCLCNSHIEGYEFGNVCNHEPTRPRKLLLHKAEIRDIRRALERKGESVLPLKIYFKHGLVKVEIAICRGKKAHDKRGILRQKCLERETQRALHHRR